MIPFGIIAPPDLAADEFIAYARDAEWHGFDQLWVVEDCFLRGGVAQAAVALDSGVTDLVLNPTGDDLRTRLVELSRVLPYVRRS